MQLKAAPYFGYWGKKSSKGQQEGTDHHLLPYHSLDVAAVGFLMLDPKKPLTIALANFLEVSPETLRQLFTFSLTLHDLGKFSSAFQALYQHESHLLINADSRMPYDGKNNRHDMLGYYFWKRLVQDDLIKLPGLNNAEGRQLKNVYRSLMVLMDCTLGHHGKPIRHAKLVDLKHFTEPHNLDAAKQFAQEMADMLFPDISVKQFADKEWCKRLEQVSWHLAGLAVLSDWIGSDRNYFGYRSDVSCLADYWSDSLMVAIEALGATDLNKKVKVRPFESFKTHYGFSPTPLQRWVETVSLDSSPQLFILEDVTGAGKTEAALALTHRLMETDAADGFYFGLPTMATSNAMFHRVADRYLQMLTLDTGVPSIVLSHGARDMNDRFREAMLSSDVEGYHYNQDDASATAQCNDWLADSRKKALLAPVGVGTIDQALLAVLPRRHQSIRLLGLHRKVLIFDEVHAADEFMFELLESLLALHLHQGGSAILLTATLSQKQRAKLCRIWHSAGNIMPIPPTQTAFPLATKVSLSLECPLLEAPLKSSAEVSRDVKMNFIHSFDSCVQRVLSAVTDGQCVVWIRNSVDDALLAFTQLQQEMTQPENCILFHSRFVLQDRKNIENTVLDIFGKKGDSTHRAGRVLIATQVFQESLDVDADVMITDICPIDDIIQRAGRLHRHTRNDQGAYQYGVIDCRQQPTLWLHSPAWCEQPPRDWLSKDFRNTQFVYRSPGRLWLGMRQLRTLGRIRMPSEARTLIESVYGDEALEQVPEALQHLENEALGKERMKAAKAKNQLLRWDSRGYCVDSAETWYNDDTDISTRHSDIETVEVLLLKEGKKGHLEPWISEGSFAVQLSTVKLSKNKFADKLQPIPAHLSDAEQLLKQQFSRAKYLQCWLPAHDTNFIYETSIGFCEKLSP